MGSRVPSWQGNVCCVKLDARRGKTHASEYSMPKLWDTCPEAGNFSAGVVARGQKLASDQTFVTPV
jgi:hypothetical protein